MQGRACPEPGRVARLAPKDCAISRESEGSQGALLVRGGPCLAYFTGICGGGDAWGGCKFLRRLRVNLRGDKC